MINKKNLITRDLKHIWHPCSQMKDYEIFKPLHVVRAKGSEIELSNGKKIIDAISSWWCKSLGHGHPRLREALIAQANKFEHVMLVNTTNETIVTLSEKLAQLTSSLNKIFYASDGSSAIEIALKMSLHTRKIQGDEQRNLFISLENSYHGETIGALSVSDLGIYREPYTDLFFPAKFISPLPYVNGPEHPLWKNCGLYWQQIEKKLIPIQQKITAILIEPIVQGAAGMKIVSQDFLRRLRAWTKQYHIHLIADEIMTGIGRTGKMLACEHANIEPDFLCLSKGLTSGWLPLSVMLTTQTVYDHFYHEDHRNSFLHSHTYSGNALAASVAIAVLQVMEEEKLCERANILGEIMQSYMQDIADRTQKITNVRGIGAIVAADLVAVEGHPRWGFHVYREAVKLGVLLRPIGNTIYWLPPLNIEMSTLDLLKERTEQALKESYKNL